MKNSLPLPANDFGLFQELLRETSGLHFDEARAKFLELALWERLQHRGYESYREYYNLLKFHPEGRLEIRELLDLITIGETYFFRNKPQFDVLMKSVLPDILRRKADSRDKCIRVWSAGCSGGDEAYSVAMAFREVVPSYEGWRISILGTDINRQGLTCAKEAVYGEKSVGYLPKEYLERYFKVRGSTYVLNPELREFVHFEYHNLAKDPLIDERMQNIDILFCRNVTIYFDSQTTRRVIGNFYNCLAEEGYLFLGHTETLWQIPHQFERIEFPQTFIYKKRLGTVQQTATIPFFIAVPQVPAESLASPKGTEKHPGERGRSGPREKPEPLARIRKPLGVHRKGELQSAQDKEIRASLNKATVLANEAKYREAAEILAKIVEMDNLNVEAYYLLGVLCHKNSNLKEAEIQFRKAIYVNPDLVLAYFNLGNIYLCQRKMSEAAREFRNAIRLLEKRPKEEQVPFCEDFTVEFLLRACTKNLGEISRRGKGYE
jgi:chemotaxis protein methyltransferase CheR